MLGFCMNNLSHGNIRRCALLSHLRLAMRGQGKKQLAACEDRPARGQFAIFFIVVAKTAARISSFFPKANACFSLDAVS
jgi:hypothetical protein